MGQGHELFHHWNCLTGVKFYGRENVIGLHYSVCNSLSQVDNNGSKLLLNALNGSIGIRCESLYHVTEYHMWIFFWPDLYKFVQGKTVLFCIVLY
jgi:hypothetical protein